MIKKISSKDKKDWENFLNSKDKLENKDSNYFQNKKSISEKTIDLHGYTLNEANKKIKYFIEKSFTERVSKINIITGKGKRSKNKNDPYLSANLGILKYSVPEFIKNDNELMKKIIEMKDASIVDGGSGAFYIYLKKKSIK